MIVRWRLREILEETGTSQRSLAAGTGISKTTINELCKGKPVEKIDMGTAERIASYFGIDWRDLFTTETLDAHSC